MRKEILTYKDAAEILEVSPATVRNWNKLKYLVSIEKKGYKYFNYKDVIELKTKIQKGELDKLNKRANKKNANNYFIPLEYLNSKNDYIFIQRIIDYISENNLSYKFSLFVLTLNYLLKNNIIISSNLKNLLKFNNNASYNNKNIYNEMHKWFLEESFFNIEVNIYNKLLEFELPDSGSDILGLLYQSLKIQSDKSKKGSFYTPAEIVENIVQEYCKKDFKVLDPCCGTGQFLLKFSDIISNPENIFGFDIDNIAVKLARINIMLKYNEIDFIPNIFTINSIFDINLQSTLYGNTAINIQNFDLIATNPPWGSNFTKLERKQLNKIFPKIKSGESFSYILLKSIEFAKSGGIISFILPESILNVKTHCDIRKFILEQTEIIKIIYFDRIFKNVFSPVIRIDCKKISKYQKLKRIKIENSNISYSVCQSRFKKNNDFIFDIHINKKDENIINKIYSIKYTTLKNQSQWALGIVTGNNKKFLSNKMLNGYEPIYKGKDILPFHLKKCNNYIKFIPDNFQQVAPESKYRVSEKLVYKFISDTLVFAYDNNQSLTLNSANIVIPLIEEYPLKTILAFFNHPIYQFVFRKKFMSIKVLRTHLESLPLPIVERSVLNKIVNFVDNVLYDNNGTVELFDYIFDLFSLTDNEKKYILEELYSGKTKKTV